MSPGLSWDARAEGGWWGGSRPWGICGCGVADQCGCGSLSQINLPGNPAVLGVTEVIVDGVTLAPASYRLDSFRRLVRVDGERWPCCQDLALAVTEPGTWQVSYAFGRVPPEAGVTAARDLACEMYQGATGGDCALPKRVTTISRQNVTLALLDPFKFFEAGRTGIYSVDLFLAAVNPKGRARRGHMASPDVGPYAVRPGA